MGFDIRFHVLTLPGRSYADYRTEVLRVEELGFDGVAAPITRAGLPFLVSNGDAVATCPSPGLSGRHRSTP
jgi:hypothetical protein